MEPFQLKLTCCGKVFMIRFLQIVFLCFFCLPALASAAEAVSHFKICGSGDSQELIRQLARLYEDRHPGIRIDVPESIGSSGGVKAAAQGQCDLGRLARPLRDKERRYNLSYKLFARSPVVFFVSANLRSTVTNITAQQVVRIFSGKTRSWQDLGGPPAKVYIANREKGDSSRTVLERHLIDFALIKKLAGKTIYSTPETVAAVANHDNTIAFAPLASVNQNPNVHVLAFEGVMPSAESISSGGYPLVSEFGLVWNEKSSAAALDFVDFLDTGEARQTIVRYGAAPITSVNK
jgi:phosphate transport system substrate-binding protein